MRFYLDADLSHQVAIIARARGVDVVSSHELGRDDLPDQDQLLLAAQEGRCVVTRNYKDFQSLTVLFFEQQWPHAGVLIVPRALPNDHFTAIAEALAAYAESRDFDLLSYTVDYLAPKR